MGKHQLSVDERRRKNREYQKKRREKIHSEAELKKVYLSTEKAKMEEEGEGREDKKYQ